MTAPKRLAFANLKGGVSKTTTAIHMADYAARFEGLRVVLVELDTQKNGSSCYADAPVLLQASSLFEPCPPDWAPPAWEGGPGVHLIPADDALMLVEASIADLLATGDAPILHYARQWLTRLDCDLIVIDTPPKGMVTLCAALVAADSVVTPFTMQSFSLDGVASLFQTIEMMKTRHNPELRYLGVLPTKINSRSVEQAAALAELEATLPDLVIPAPVSERAAISTAMDRRHPVWVHTSGASGREAAKEYKAACAQIFARVFQ